MRRWRSGYGWMARCFLWDLEVGGPPGTLVWVEGSNEKVNAHHVEPSGAVPMVYAWYRTCDDLFHWTSGRPASQARQRAERLVSGRHLVDVCWRRPGW